MPHCDKLMSKRFSDATNDVESMTINSKSLAINNNNIVCSSSTTTVVQSLAHKLTCSGPRFECEENFSAPLYFTHICQKGEEKLLLRTLSRTFIANRFMMLEQEIKIMQMEYESIEDFSPLGLMHG